MSGPLSRRAFVAGVLATATATATGLAGCAATEPGAPPPGATPGPGSGTLATPGGTAASSPTDTGGPTGTTGEVPAGRARFVTRGPDGRDQVALTFHTNGDLQLAQQLLDHCRDGDAVITAFVVGDWLTANPTWAKKLTDAGHELANHTFTHPDFASLPPAAMATEITRCRDAIARLSGDGGRFFRPSGTDDGLAPPSDPILRAAADAGYATVLGWDVEPFDYQDPGRDAVVRRVLGAVRGGSIVSLHFGHPGTVAALPAILEGIRGKGLRTATASALLGS